ncbi:glycosyltransferase family 4 protein [Ancylobacter radicis]|uniref:Glycosyltransferase family 4 protein n=1 Tax=Ancylobacter radicis TaxID=2836179 RepID=A0ABS5R5C2_9HYPH|nr:glycosyltransferase family 4 protein [Ancylobacter radicis]MBS9475979.1 glycosyltransferase family 4 protein [Ancylobacter radicis]
MKILMVSPITACPPTAGNRARVVALARAVRDLGHELHFAFLAPIHTDDATAHADNEPEFGRGRFHLVSLSDKDTLHSRIRARWRRARREYNIFNPHIYRLDEFYYPSYDRSLRFLQDTHRFDAVICEYVFMSRALENFDAATLKILDTHDAFGDRHLEFLKVGRTPQWFSTPKAQELRGFRRADAVIAIQPSEAERFSRDLGSTPPQMHTISHFLDLSRRATLSDAPAAVFVGSRNDINISAVDHLQKAILPRILARRPDFRLVVAGAICERVPDQPGVVKLGQVNHVSDAFAHAPISLNPTIFGTGINIKQLDAMAAGVPSVSTQTGSRGFEAPERDAYIATVPDDDPDGFAEAVVALLADPDRCRLMADSAFAAAQAWNQRQMDALATLLVSKTV